MATNNNVLKKNWKILLLLSSFSVLILGLITSIIWFFGYRTTVSYGNGADFAKDVDDLLLLTVGAISIATLAASIAIAITFPEAAVIMSFLQKLGITAVGMSPFAAATLILKYVNTVHSTRSQYDSLRSLY